MSMASVQKFFENIRNFFGNDRKRPADQEDFYLPSKKFRRLGYDFENEYSDTEMDFLGNSRQKKRTLNQKRLSMGTNHMSNGFNSTSSNHRTSNVLPDDDVVYISDQPPSTSTVFVTRIRPFGATDPVAHSSFATNDVPSLIPLAKTPFAASSTLLPRASTSNFSFTQKPVPRGLPINSILNGGGSFMSASMRKHNEQSRTGFKGLDTVERMSRGHAMASMARAKSPVFGNSVMSINTERNDKEKYYELLKQVCPDLYSKTKMNSTDLIDLTKTEDGPKGSSSSKVVDLTESQPTTRSVSPTEVNTLMERLSCKPVFKPDLISKINKTHEVNAERRKAQIAEEEKMYNQRRNETDEAMRSFRKRYSGISETVDQLMQRIDDGIEEEEEEEEVAYPQLTAEHQKTIKFALYGGAPSEVIIDKFNMRITRNDLNTLVGITWLNDEVINFYMNLLMERAEQRTDLPKAYCFNTFFIPTLMQRGHGGVRRWTRKVDIFSYDLIPVPVHVGGVHWCMAIIRMKEKIIRYYDSMGNPNQPVLDALERYLVDESMDKRKIVFDTSDWKKESIRDCPQQRNGSDCGVFSCMNAEHLTRNAPLKFSQNEMPYFRQKMVLEIATGKLLT